MESLNGQIIDHQRPLLVKFADDDKRRRQLMTRYLPQTDTNLTNPTNLRDPSDVLSAQLAQLNLLTNTSNPNDNQQQQGQDMNLLMNTLLMMPFWSNMCAPNISMPVLYPNGLTTNPTVDQKFETLPTDNGA